MCLTEMYYMCLTRLHYMCHIIILFVSYRSYIYFFFRDSDNPIILGCDYNNMVVGRFTSSVWSFMDADHVLYIQHSPGLYFSKS